MKPTVLPCPTRVQIETTSKCNFRCASCMHSFDGYRRRALGHLPADRFVHILREIPDLTVVELQGVGEPFLNPEVPEMIRQAGYRGVSVHTFSNGSRIEAKLAQELVEARLHSLTFSIDAASPELFESLRPGGRFEQVLANVQEVIEAKKRCGSETPYLNVNTVVSQRNKDEIPRIVELAARFGDIRNVTFVKLNTLIAPHWQEMRLDDREAREIEERFKGEAGGPQVRFYFKPMTFAERQACWWPRQWAYISVEGYVTPCCNYCDPAVFNMGNIFVKPFRDIWHGDQYLRFREALEAGDLRPECASC